jgi:large subunit ribosomal protein L22
MICKYYRQFLLKMRHTYTQFGSFHQRFCSFFILPMYVYVVSLSSSAVVSSVCSIPLCRVSAFPLASSTFQSQCRSFSVLTEGVHNPRVLHHALSRSTVKPEDTATYHSRIRILKHDPHTIAAENSAAAAADAQIPVSPLAAAIDGVAVGGNAGTDIALVPGEEAYTGQSALPAGDESVFRSSSSAQIARSSRHNIPISPQKLNDICRTVRGVGVHQALIQLRLSQKKKAHIVASVINSAATGAVHNHNMDKKRLYISQIFIGHGSHLKRVDIKGRGRCGIKLKYRSHLFVQLKEQGSDPEKYKGTWKGGGRSHDKNGKEIRIGRIGPLISTVQRTLEHMREWRTARGIPSQIVSKKKADLVVDYQRAYRSSGIATDFDLVYGRQMPEEVRSVPKKGVIVSGPVDNTAAALAELAAEEDRILAQQENK